MLKRLLNELERQHTDEQFTYSIVVGDNDGEQSARPVVAEFAAKSRIEVIHFPNSGTNAGSVLLLTMQVCSDDQPLQSRSNSVCSKAL